MIKALHRDLEEKGYNVLLTREPGGTLFSEKVRSLLLVEGKGISATTELLLILAARNDHVEKVISPELARGMIVLCDRFIDSTIVYQGFAAGLDPDEVEKLACHIVPLIPDCTFLLDLPLHESIKRRDGRQEFPDTMEQKELSFHEQVRFGFLAIAKKYPQRIHVLDASESVEQIFEKARVSVLNMIREKA